MAHILTVLISPPFILKDEAPALDNAERHGEKRASTKWKSVVAEKDAIIAKLRSRLTKVNVSRNESMGS